MNIIWYPAFTLDGYIASRDGDSDWVIDKDEQLFVEEVQKAGSTIVGATTFKQYQGVIYPIKGTKTYVVTRHADKFKSDDFVIYVKPDAVAICQRISQDGFTDAVLSGGGETNGLFAAANKIDEVIASIYPTVLGDGIKLTGSFAGKLNLKLVNSTDIGQSVIQNRYRVIK